MAITDIIALLLKFAHSHNQTSDLDAGTELPSGCGKRPCLSLHPVPRFVSSDELMVIESSLSRWAADMEQDMAGGWHRSISS